MNKTPICLYAASLFILLAASIGSAQATSFNYQGSLNTSGAPASGNHDFEFAIFDAGGLQIGPTLTRLNVPVNNGTFSVELDFGNQFPGTGRLLEIRVRTSGSGAFTTLAPRQLLTSTPHAIRSLDSAQLGGINASQYILAGATTINAGSQFNINGVRVLTASNLNSNTFVGADSGSVNIGNDNSFFGRQAGLSNTSGQANSFFGSSAGRNNKTGLDNSFFGNLSGSNNVSGSSNAFFGERSGTENNTGLGNAFFGSQAGEKNVFGSGNSFFGTRAGQLTVGFGSNSFFGSRAGNNNTTGQRNSFFGVSAGLGSITGNDNSFFGGLANSTDGLTNATAIGYQTMVTQSNSLVLGSINGTNGASANTRVGIGIPNPIARLTVAGDGSGIFSGDGTGFLLINKTAGKGYGQSVNDLGTMLFHTTTHDVNSNSALGRIAFDANGNVGIGTQAPAHRLHVTNGASGAASISTADFVIEDNASAFQHFLTPNDIESGILFGDAADSIAGGLIFNNATTNNGIQFRAGGNTTRMTLDGSGNLGIGTTAPARQLHVASGVSGATSFSASDLVVEDDTAAFQHFLTPDDVESGILFGDPSATIGGGFIFNNAATNNGIQFRAGGNTTRMTLDGSGNLGVGTNAPNAKLEVRNGSILSSGTGAGLTVNNPANEAVNVQLAWIDGKATIQTFRPDGAVAADFQITRRSGNGITTLLSTSGTSVGIGTDTPGAKLDVAGSVKIAPGTAGGNGLCLNSSSIIAFCSSSMRYKKNVQPFTSGLSLLNRLAPVSFNWKSNSARDLGLVAEEVAKVEPLLTTTNENGEIEGVKYDRIGVVLINAVKEQQAQIEAQKTVIEKQQRQIDALKQIVCSRSKRAKACR